MSATEVFGIDLVNNLPGFRKDVQLTTRALNSMSKAADKTATSLAKVPSGLPAITGPVALNPSSVSTRGGGGGHGGGGRKAQTRSQRIVNALMSTRLNIGHASPLVGRTAAALGLTSATAAPALLIAGAAAAAASALYHLAESSAAAGNAFGRFTDATGSSGSSAAQLQMLGTAGGIDTASIAQSIQEHITSDPAGMAAGLRLGVHNLPGPYGNQDYGQQALTVVASLRKITNVVERLRLARAVGAEGLLPLTRLSDSQFAKSQGDSNVRSSIMSPEFLQKSADFQASFGRIGDAIQNLLAAAGQEEMQRLTNLFNHLADALNGLASWIQGHQGFVDFVTQAGEISSGLLGAGVSASQGNDLTRAVDENTKATRDNTAIIGKPGFYGHTTRGSSMPSGWNGQSLNDQATIGLSAF